MNWLLVVTFVLFAAFMEGRVAATEDHLVTAEAEKKAAEDKARLFAAVIAPCLKGGVTLTVSNEPVAECRKLRKR